MASSDHPAVPSSQETAFNLLNREFEASRPNQKWVSDITYIDTAEGWLYLASNLDMRSQLVVGWVKQDQMDVDLVEDAWKMTLLNLSRTRPAPSLELEQPFTNEFCQTHMPALQCTVSMSRTANCYDNAVAESFFATLTTGFTGTQYESKGGARFAIFEYIEGWNYRQRLHSSQGYLSPVEFALSSGR